MCEPVSMAIAAAAAVVGTGAQIAQGAKQSKLAKASASQAMKDAAATKAANDRAVNQANAKKPNLNALFDGNMMANAGGIGSTMLTGAAGAKPTSALLGRSSLLGS